jgi:hypothetical protein
VAISQRTPTQGTAASGAALTVTFPAGSTTGDLLLLIVANAGTTPPNAPTGWTRFYSGSAGTAQNLAVFSAPWAAGLTTSFTNAASAAAWICNAYASGGDQVDMDANTVATNTTSNTTLPTGAPTVGGVGGYEVLCYAWTSAATISGVASGSAIDATQANSTTISASLGHNTTNPLAAGSTPTAFAQTLNAANTRKSGLGVILRDSKNVPRPATPVSVSLADVRRRAQVSWIDLFVPLAAPAAPTRTASPVYASLLSNNVTHTGSPVSAALLRLGVTHTASPVTASLVTVNVHQASPVSVSMTGVPTRPAAPVTVSLQSNAPRRARVSWVMLTLPDPTTPNINTATPVSVSLSSSNIVRRGSPVTVVMLASTPFVTSVHPSGRYLLDQFGAPYFVQGNSPQNMSGALSAADIHTFFQNQQAKGCNSSQVHLMVNDRIAGTGRSVGGKNDPTGFVPFTNMSNFTGPVTGYWSLIDTLFDEAALAGHTVWASPCENISWGPTVGGMSDTDAFNFGVWIGNRYKGRPNLVWSFGNDWDSGQWFVTEEKVRQVVAGIRASGDTHLAVTWLYSPDSISWDGPNSSWDTLHQVCYVYTYAAPYQCVARSYAHVPIQPTLFGEGNYDAENLNGGFDSRQRVRETAWWAVTWGASGQFTGQQSVWQFSTSSLGAGGDWHGAADGQINSTSAYELSYIAALMPKLPSWHLLVPDTGHVLITAGAGTYISAVNGDASTWQTNDYATAAISSDHRLAVVYVPSVRTWTLNTSMLLGTAHGYWYDPTNGTQTVATAPWTMPSTFHPDGTQDWVLVLQGTGATASPVTASLTSGGTRVGTASASLITLGAVHLATPVSVSLSGFMLRPGSPVSASLAASGTARPASPVSVSLLLAGVTRPGSPVSASLASSGTVRLGTPITASLVGQRVAVGVTVSLAPWVPFRLATVVTVSLSGGPRMATPVTAALKLTNATRTALPASVSLAAFSAVFWDSAMRTFTLSSAVPATTLVYWDVARGQFTFSSAGNHSVGWDPSSQRFILGA